MRNRGTDRRLEGEESVPELLDGGPSPFNQNGTCHWSSRTFSATFTPPRATRCL
jgi:hypothetical protein